MPVPRFSEKFYRDFYSSFAPQFFNKMVSLRLILMPNVPKETEREKNAGPRKEKKSKRPCHPICGYHARTRPLKKGKQLEKYSCLLST